MVLYICECCSFETKLKSNYYRHINTKKHTMLSQSYPNVTPKLSLVTPMLPLETKISCKYCNSEFKYRSGLSRHIKYTCKKNEDEDLQELVKLMNEQLQQQKAQLNEIKEENSSIICENNKIKKEIEKRDKKIMKLTNKLQINNNGIINNINNNIKVLNYKDSDLSHLTDKDYAYCIGRTNNSIKALTELIHFNPKKPENMNIFKSNLKNEYITLKERDVWVVKKYIDDFIEDKELILEDWLEREGEKYPGLRDKFEMFINNKENENILNTIKENICLLLYNNREKIKQIGN